MTDLGASDHSPAIPFFHLHPAFDFGLEEDLSQPRTLSPLLPELPLMLICYIAPCHSDSISPLPSLPVNASVCTSHFGSLATCITAPILLHSNPIPPASQPPSLSQPTRTFICAPIVTTSMANSSHVSGPATMPCPHSNAAPFFSGTLDNPIDDFLAEYSELADGHRLSKWQKCELVVQYIDPKLRNHWKSMAGYAS